MWWHPSTAEAGPAIINSGRARSPAREIVVMTCDLNGIVVGVTGGWNPAGSGEMRFGTEA